MASFLFLFILFSNVQAKFFSESFDLSWTTLSDLKQAEFKSLLHISDAKKISDPKFLLTSANQDISTIFNVNLQKYKTETQRYACQFPARSKWFAELFNQSPPNFQHCSELNEYLTQVSAENISVVYASENLVSPSSFMGHAFLKLSSASTESEPSNTSTKEHAISFFTDISGYNVPKIIFESLVTGKEGIFLVSPYEENQIFYNQVENRELYEYGLSLTDQQKELIKLHLWELKDKDIEYFFHTHNCATITLDILSLANPKLLTDKNEWISPLDVVKRTQQVNLHNNVLMSPSVNWQLRVYGDLIDENNKLSIENDLKHGQPISLINETETREESYIRYEYAKALNEKLFHNNKIAQERYVDNIEQMDEISSQYSDLTTDLSTFKDPRKRPKEAQWSFEARNRTQQENAVTIAWLPVSHTLYDDNRNSFSESGLEIFHIRALADKDKIKLENLTLYKIQSYLPYDARAGGYSGRFSLEWDNQRKLPGLGKEHLLIDGQFGYSYGINDKRLIYLTGGTSVAADLEHLWLSPAIEIGSIAQFGKIKTHLNYEFNWNEFNKEKFNQTIGITTSYFFEPNQAIDFYVDYFNHDFRRDSTTVGIKYRYRY